MATSSSVSIKSSILFIYFLYANDSSSGVNIYLSLCLIRRVLYHVVPSIGGCSLVCLQTSYSYLDFHVLGDKSCIQFGIFVDVVVAYVLILVRDSMCFFVISTVAGMIIEFAVQIDVFKFPLSHTVLHVGEFYACHCV